MESLDQFRAEDRLRLRRAVSHRENLALWAHVPLRIAMAIETPLHLERRLLADERHFVHAAVARFAADALLDVHAVVEEREVRQVVDAQPAQRRVVAEARADRLEVRARG